MYKGPRLKVKFDLTILFSEFALIVFHFWGFFADFFIQLDRQCGPLTLHSSLRDLVRYVRAGVQRLRDAYIPR